MMTRFFVLAVLLSLLSLSSAQRPSNTSICVYYTQALFTNDTAANEYNLVSSVVARAVLGGQGANFSGQVIDGIAQSPTTSGATNPIIGYFNGQIQFRSGAPDYTRNNFTNADFSSLAGKLFNYFGALLGCNYINTSPFSGVSTSDMYAVHQNMSINNAQETYFNTAVAKALLSFGVTMADANAAGSALGYFNRYGAGIPGNNFIDSSKRTQICGASDCPNATNANAALYTTSGASSAASVSIAMVLATMVAVASLVL